MRRSLWWLVAVLGCGLGAACATGSNSYTETDEDNPSGGNGGDGVGGTAGPGPTGPGPGGSANGGAGGDGGSSSNGGGGSGASGAGGGGGSGNGGGGGGGPMCSELITNGGFENAGFWTESSTNFGTPICDASCGLGGGSGPHGGLKWYWGGGININLPPETATVSKALVIPSGTATLTWYMEIPSCEGFGFDTFDVLVDGSSVYSTDDTDASCDLVGWVQKSVSLNAYANGASHTIAFTTYAESVFVSTNFMVDDVSLIACQ